MNTENHHSVILYNYVVIMFPLIVHSFDLEGLRLSLHIHVEYQAVKGIGLFSQGYIPHSLS